MADLRTLLAAVLGIVIGVLCLVYPGAIIRIQTVGRLPHDRSGEYGAGATTPERWRRIVQAVGLGVLVVGAYFGVTLLQSSGLM
ncbi:MAG: hypothetical protein ABEH65_02400 [Halobacteriales archaeon]